jgi:hypothetical protein
MDRDHLRENLTRSGPTGRSARRARRLAIILGSLIATLGVLAQRRCATSQNLHTGKPAASSR